VECFTGTVGEVKAYIFREFILDMNAPVRACFFSGPVIAQAVEGTLHLFGTGANPPVLSQTGHGVHVGAVAGLNCQRIYGELRLDGDYTGPDDFDMGTGIYSAGVRIEGSGISAVHGVLSVVNSASIDTIIGEAQAVHLNSTGVGNRMVIDELVASLKSARAVGATFDTTAIGVLGVTNTSGATTDVAILQGSLAATQNDVLDLAVVRRGASTQTFAFSRPATDSIGYAYCLASGVGTGNISASSPALNFGTV
jgi:hypothetical protein